jgi:hypothetical protein
MFLSCSKADERRCGLGGATKTEAEEKRCLKRKKEDFCEAMRSKLIIPHSKFGLETLPLVGTFSQKRSKLWHEAVPSAEIQKS